MGAGYVLRLTDYAVGLGVAIESILQPMADESNRQVSNVDANPPPAESFCYGNGGAAAAERIKH